MSLLTTTALCASFLCAPLLLNAQPTLRTLTGIVTDSHHEPLAGAVVQLQDEDTGTVISYITSRTGRYTFKRLSSDDDYYVWATFRDGHSRRKNLSKFDSKPTRNISLVVKPR